MNRLASWVASWLHCLLPKEVRHQQHDLDHAAAERVDKERAMRGRRQRLKAYEEAIRSIEYQYRVWARSGPDGPDADTHGRHGRQGAA